MKHQSAYLLMLLALGCNPNSVATNPSTSPDEKPQSLESRTFTIGGSTFKLQLADDDAERSKGLMYRQSMPADEGMIFVFTDELPRGFWMKSVPIDLDILYLDHAGRIVSIKTMQAYATNTVPSDDPAMYAIELNAGLAEKLKLTKGMKIDLSPLKNGVR